MRETFVYTILPVRALFDVAAADGVACEADRLKWTRVLLITAPGGRAAAASGPILAAIGGRVAAVFADAREHVPVEVLTACIEAHGAVAADGIVAIGGGSAIGLGKLVAARTKTPLIAVPTTYSGAEMTPFNAVTENGVKTQHRDVAMLPAAIVYDPELTLTLPLAVTGPSMMNALAHAIEGLYAPETNPVVALKSEMAIQLAARALPKVAARLDDRDGRRDLLLSAMLSGEVLAVTSVGLHHKLCHILGGAFGLSHAGVNAVILPYAIAYNATGAPDAMARIAVALGIAGDQTRDVAGAIFDLAQASGASASLAALGLPEEAIEIAARTAAGQTYANPVPLDVERLRGLLAAAYRGDRPPTAW
ncbi:MAG: iron-containing alcohol dehydrogenase [Hyphomicrobium aestuarii]|nr:iron-containing alcohol dehydrogenase [Hyphomicrobium aestuarii]